MSLLKKYFTTLTYWQPHLLNKFINSHGNKDNQK